MKNPDQNDHRESKRVSYKETLIGFNGIESGKEEDMDFCDLGSEDEEKRSQAKGLELPLAENSEDPACPVIQVTNAEKAELYMPWKLSLTVKLLGKGLGMKSIKLRLQKLWNL